MEELSRLLDQEKEKNLKLEKENLKFSSQIKLLTQVPIIDAQSASDNQNPDESSNLREQVANLKKEIKNLTQEKDKTDAELKSLRILQEDNQNLTVHVQSLRQEIDECKKLLNDNEHAMYQMDKEI